MYHWILKHSVSARTYNHYANVREQGKKIHIFSVYILIRFCESSLLKLKISHFLTDIKSSDMLFFSSKLHQILPTFIKV